MPTKQIYVESDLLENIELYSIYSGMSKRKLYNKIIREYFEKEELKNLLEVIKERVNKIVVPGDVVRIDHIK